MIAMTLFQSTHPYGCDISEEIDLNDWKGFNPRTHTGATAEDWQEAYNRMVSIHAPIRVRPGQ